MRSQTLRYDVTKLNKSQSWDPEIEIWLAHYQEISTELLYIILLSEKKQKGLKGHGIFINNIY